MATVFIDNLGLELITLIFASGITVYLTGNVYLEYRKNGTKNIESALRQGALPLGLVGAVVTILGLWGEMTWPFPGGEAKFNILFGDPYLIFGIILLSMALAIHFRQKLSIVGFFALLGGLMAIYYGALLYSQGLTQSPLGALAMYLAFGIAGVFTFPATLAYDNMEGKDAKGPGIYAIFLILFWLAFIAAAIFSAIIGVPAVQGHLLSTP